MKRIVPIIVTDDEVDSFSIEFHGPDGHRGVSAYHVPPDGQLALDLDALTKPYIEAAEDWSADPQATYVPVDVAERAARAYRLRAAFRLEGEES